MNYFNISLCVASAGEDKGAHTCPPGDVKKVRDSLRSLVISLISVTTLTSRPIVGGILLKPSTLETRTGSRWNHDNFYYQEQHCTLVSGDTHFQELFHHPDYICIFLCKENQDLLSEGCKQRAKCARVFWTVHSNLPLVPSETSCKDAHSMF